MSGVGFFYRVHLSKDLKEAREETFWESNFQRKREICQSGVCLLCLQTRSTRSRQVTRDKAWWPRGPLKGLWFLFTVGLEAFQGELCNQIRVLTESVQLLSGNGLKGEVRKMGKPVGKFL